MKDNLSFLKTSVFVLAILLLAMSIFFGLIVVDLHKQLTAMSEIVYQNDGYARAGIIELKKDVSTLSENIRQNDEVARTNIIDLKMDVSTLEEQVAQIQGGKLPSVKVGCTTKVPVGNLDVISQIQKNHLMMVVTGVPEEFLVDSEIG
jgi:hypothetical protein